jgi:hypothetical protein
MENCQSLPQADKEPTWAAGAVRRVLVVLACLGLASCGAGEPTPFSRGEDIPLGEATLRVYKAEVTSQFLPAYIGTKAGMTNAVVSFTFQTPQLKEEKTVKEKMKLINSLYLTLVTDEGKKITSPLILPADQYRLMLAGQAEDLEAVKSYMLSQTSGLVPDDFVAVFVIPQGAKDLTLHIYNPAVKEGQARLASVMVW